MSDQEIPKAYNAQDWENKLYARWEKSGFFNPDECIRAGATKADAVAFSIVLPPPNVTGTLHTGSACMLALEDLIVRYHRMKGDRTLWVPGTDHAAIATQSKVEKIIFKEESKTRHDLGREELLRRVEAFAKQSHDTIIHQTKKLGSSLDWSREAYTLDEKRSLAVRTAFKKMYDDGLIYRGYRVVNWTVAGQSTCSDDEVVSIERQTKLYTFKYSKDFPISIATTRPETKLGDTAVAVHPEDERYKQYIGQTFTAEVGAAKPLEIKIIGDETVDPAFGTGAVGVTPAHSHTDFEMRERHPEIDMIQVIGSDGKMTTEAGKGYAGLAVLDAREKFIAFLRDNDLLEKEETTVQNVGTSDRYEDVLEVIPMKQWFIGVNKEFTRNGKKVTLKSLMLDAVQSGKTKILPERFEKVYFNWINNLRDWCISRQIWFGHRIPVWYKGEEIYCGINPPEGDDWEQDPDTLDTWFSSGLWTFSTLGWPDTEAKDFLTYHPTTLLETGYDIIFFWVARMILMTTYLLDTVPFKTIYLHGLVRDEQGRKMSKSLDNIINPLDTIEKYGADALRLALVIGSTPGNDLRLGNEKIESFRNFTNKLWNIGRYINNTEISARPAGGRNQESGITENPEAKSGADYWILSRLNETVEEVTRLIENYQLSLAGEKLRDFTWNEFADWYVEIHKVEKNDAVLRSVFETLLKLWHPFMPFVTEAIWQTSHENPKKLLMIEKWPDRNTSRINADGPTIGDNKIQSSFKEIIGLIQEIRAIKSLYRIDPITKLNITIQNKSESSIQENESIFKCLARVDEIHSSETIPPHAALAQSGSLQAFIELEGVIDFDAERKRIEQEKSEKTKYIVSLESKLSNQNFINRAKPEIVETERIKLEAAKKQLADFNHHLSSLNS